MGRNVPSRRFIDADLARNFRVSRGTVCHFRSGRDPGGVVLTFATAPGVSASHVDPTKEAFAAFRSSHLVFSRLGGRIVWRGNFELMLIGPVDERWDECFIAEYPTVAAFVEMIREPVYREAVQHCQAAVLDSRLIRLAPAAAGSGFGGSA
jgi:uncharacterized protein (DUF1330 family)